jgi:hypothetical protein
VQLNLTIRNSSSSSTSVTACRTFDWNGSTYTTSGIYSYSTTNSVGCDSIATLNLNIITLITNVINQSACDSYFWNGNTYTTTGDYSFLSQSVGGCDSIAVLSLTIHNSPVANITPNDTILFCPLNPVTLNANPNMSTYLWSNGATTQSIMTSLTGIYSVFITDQFGCTSTSAVPAILVNITQTDFNNDGFVDIDDYLLFVPLYGQQCSCPQDLDGDGDVDIDDYLLFLPAFGSDCN